MDEKYTAKIIEEYKDFNIITNCISLACITIVVLIGAIKDRHRYPETDVDDVGLLDPP